VVLKNNSTMNVSGNLIVDGNFEAQNNVDLSVDGSVDIGGDIIVDKGDLTILDDGTVTVGGNCTWTEEICAQILPVDLLSFSARPVGEVVLVNWATAVEKDNDYFMIQSSLDGREYSDIVQVKGAGNSDTRQDYAFTDEYPSPGESYYRLIQVDFNGIRTLYTPVKVDRGFTGDIGIYPNPVDRNGTVRLYTGGKMDDKVSLALFSVDGSVLWEHEFTGNSQDITFPEDIRRGAYLLEVRTGNVRKLHRLVLK
ncbi:MAG: T9SS type A sorting domain-containing protein, partial [Cyclobacteriaceae bacterium]